jgi:hypothetical protein
MPSSTPEFDLQKIAQNMKFLSQNAHGPASIREELFNWAAALENDNTWALAFSQIKRTIAQLICIANASAAFQRSVAPPFCSGPMGLNVEDRGGYFLARHLVTTLITSLPLNAAERLELANHALSVEDRHRRALERFLPLR